MTLEESQQQPPVTSALPTRNEFTVKLVETSNNTAYNNLAKLISVDEYTDQKTGRTFTARMLTHIEIGQLKKLQKQEDLINQDDDWDKYIVNLREQSKLLINDITDEIFDKSDWYILENLIVAWRMKPRGFRAL